MSPEPETTTGSGLARGLTWVLKTTIRLIATLLLLLALAFLIQFGLRLLTQSIDRVDSRVDLLDGDVGRLMEASASQGRDIAAMQADLTAQDDRLQGLAEDLNSQQAALAALEEQAAELTSGAADTSEELAAQGSALTALQGDLVADSAQLDELGGLLDGLAQALQESVDEADGRLAALEAVAETPQEELARLQRAVSLFRLWELVARARLRLSESNPGLAAADAQQALAGANLLAAQATDLELNALQTRLTLAVNNLPADPAAAARDLESAWESIDQLLASLLAPGLEGAELLSAPALSITSTLTTTVPLTGTATITPTATPSP